MLALRNKRSRLGALIVVGLCVLAAIGFGLVELISGTGSTKARTTVSAVRLAKYAPPVPKGAELAKLKAMALRVAAASNDKHPTSIEIVPTTAAEATFSLHGMPGKRVRKSRFGVRRPVYLVVVHGHFRCESCPSAVSGFVITGSAFVSVVDPRTNRVGSFGFMNKAPKIANLGPVTTIEF